jgi:hypothetical protein
MAFDFKTIANDKRFIVALIVFATLLILWFVWPSGKPPEKCPNSQFRPGELIQEGGGFRALSVRVIGADCKPSANPATPDEIKAAQARMETWRAYDQAQAQKAFGAIAGGGSTGFLETVLSAIGGPVGTFFAFVIAAWALILAVALFLFLIGFVVVAVLGLRHAPIAIITAPIFIWWKVLIEFPTLMIDQVLSISIANAETNQRLKKNWRQILKVILGIAPPELAPRSTELGSAEFASSGAVVKRSAQDAPQQQQAPINIGIINGRGSLKRTPWIWYFSPNQGVRNVKCSEESVYARVPRRGGEVGYQ